MFKSHWLGILSIQDTLFRHVVQRIQLLCITKTRLFKYIEHFTSKKLKIFGIKNSDIFHISAKNIYCGYSLEPPRPGGSNEYPQAMFEQI